MAYGNFRNRRKTRMVAVGKPKKTIQKARVKRAPRMTFAKKVQKIISSNNENKFTATLLYNDGVARATRAASVDTYSFFTWTPGQDATGSRLFNIGQTAANDGRIGNTIKLKRWIIKGMIQPIKSATTILENSYIGYVDVYFGKLMKNIAPPANTLIRLYQNGSSATTPSCKSTDMLNPLNKDNYKVYYHRRFKMGAASDTKTYDENTAMNVHSANNDFKLSQTFGFDVCKYILKDRYLKFPDTEDPMSSTFLPPNNADIVNMTLWATYTPQSGQATGTGTSGTFRSLYSLDCLTYAEYEDA